MDAGDVDTTYREPTTDPITSFLLTVLRSPVRLYIYIIATIPHLVFPSCAPRQQSFKLSSWNPM